MKIFFGRSVAIMAGLLIFIAIGEVGYRAYIYFFKPLHRPSEVSGLLWEPTPGARKIIGGIEYAVNANGFRGYKYNKAKDDGVLRIAVVGDSVTWGLTDFEDTYPRVMERELLLGLKGEKVEVLNFGIEGTDSQHQLNLLKERVVDYDPDIVVLGYCLNDMSLTSTNPVILWFIGHVRFLNFVAVKGMTFISAVRAWAGNLTGKTYYKRVNGYYNDTKRVTKMRHILLEMKTILQARGTKFMIAIFPFRQQFGKGAEFKPQETILTVCTETGIDCLNNFDDMARHNPAELYLEDDFIHFSSLGNKILARSIESFLYKKGYLRVHEGI